MLPRGSVAPVSIIPVPRVAVIVVAAGSGSRLAAGIPKAFVGLDDHAQIRMREFHICPSALRNGLGRPDQVEKWLDARPGGIARHDFDLDTHFR